MSLKEGRFNGVKEKTANNAYVETFTPKYVEEKGGFMSEAIYIRKDTDAEPVYEVRLLSKGLRLIAGGFHNFYKEQTVLIQEGLTNSGTTFLPRSEAAVRYGKDVIDKLFSELE